MNEQQIQAAISATEAEQATAQSAASAVINGEVVVADASLTADVNEGVKDESSTIPSDAAPIVAEVIDPVISAAEPEIMPMSLNSEGSVIVNVGETPAVAEQAPIEVKPIVEAPIIEAPAAVIFTPKSEDTQEPNEELEYINKMRTEGTEIQKRILAAVESFAGQMQPRVAIIPTKGVSYQYEFLQHLLWLLEKNYEEFRGGWNLLLVYFSVFHGKPTAANYSALSEFSTNRFLPFWTKGEDKADAYRNLITVLRATRNRATRKHDINTISLERIAPGVLSSQALDNLKTFYKI